MEMTSAKETNCLRPRRKKVDRQLKKSVSCKRQQEKTSKIKNYCIVRFKKWLKMGKKSRK